MGSSGTSQLVPWFTSFGTKLIPNQDVVKIGRTFFKYWSHSLKPGKAYATDPEGNVIILTVTIVQNSANFSAGGLKMAEFYNLNSVHTVAFDYIRNNKFGMRIFSLDGLELGYPVVMNRRSSSANLDSDNWFKLFRTKIYPEKDDMRIDGIFKVFWNQRLINGNAYVTDPQGNEFCLRLFKGSHESSFASGVQNIVNYYQLASMHYVWIYYSGNNRFNMRIFTLDNEEINYPINISDSETHHEVINSSWTKTLSVADISGKNPLLIPAHYVKEKLSPKQEDIFLITERGGRRYHCTIRHGLRTARERYIGYGWYQFVKENGLAEGNVLQFWSVDDPHELYVRINRN